jgi:hypothetical protein
MCVVASPLTGDDGRLQPITGPCPDGRLSDGKAELEQLAMNVRRTPKPIVNAHLPDQGPQFCGDWWPASRGAGFPAPVAAKPSAMPAWPHDYHGLENRWTPAIKLDEEQAIAVRELDPTEHLSLQHHQLLPERGILCFRSVLHRTARPRFSPLSAGSSVLDARCSLDCCDNYYHQPRLRAGQSVSRADSANCPIPPHPVAEICS